MALVGCIRIDGFNQLIAHHRTRSTLGHIRSDYVSHTLAHTLLARIRCAHLDRLGLHLIPGYRLLASRHQRVLAQHMRLSRRYLLSRFFIARLLLYTSCHHGYRLCAYI